MAVLFVRNLGLPRLTISHSGWDILLIYPPSLEHSQRTGYQDVLWKNTERFDHVVAAVKSLCSFEDKSGENRFGTPSLALKLGHSLKKCVYIIWGKAVLSSKGKDREEDAVDLEKLFEREWGWSGLAPVFNNPFSQEVQ